MRMLGGLLALTALTACQVIDRIAGPAEAPPVVAAVPRSAMSASPEDLMAYLARLRGMNEAAITAEAARQKQLAARTPDDLTRLKAALALTLVQSEEAEILALADPIARKANAPGEVRAVASFLQVLMIDRRRLRESAAAAKGTLSAERRAFEAQKQRADALQERATQLQQKLDALTELEKSLSDRPPSSR